MALTVGVATVMAAREVAIIITGAHKAYAVRVFWDLWHFSPLLLPNYELCTAVQVH